MAAGPVSRLPPLVLQIAPPPLWPQDFGMRRIVWIAAIGLTVPACRGPRATAPAVNPAMARPVKTAIGRIASVNQKLRYVVINFQSVPSVDTRMNVYRANLKV